jgi:hypothetical protein
MITKARRRGRTRRPVNAIRIVTPAISATYINSTTLGGEAATAGLEQ